MQGEGRRKTAAEILTKFVIFLNVHSIALRANFASSSTGRHSSSFSLLLLSIFVLKTLLARVCSTMLRKEAARHRSLGNTHSTHSHSREAKYRLENQGLQKCCKEYTCLIQV